MEGNDQHTELLPDIASELDKAQNRVSRLRGAYNKAAMDARIKGLPAAEGAALADLRRAEQELERLQAAQQGLADERVERAKQEQHASERAADGELRAALPTLSTAAQAMELATAQYTSAFFELAAANSTVARLAQANPRLNRAITHEGLNPLLVREITRASRPTGGSLGQRAVPPGGSELMPMSVDMESVRPLTEHLASYVQAIESQLDAAEAKRRKE